MRPIALAASLVLASCLREPRVVAEPSVTDPPVFERRATPVQGSPEARTFPNSLAVEDLRRPEPDVVETPNVATVEHDADVQIKPLGDRRFLVTQTFALHGARAVTLLTEGRALQMDTQATEGGARDRVSVTMTVRLAEGTDEAWATRENLAFMIRRADVRYFARFPPSFDNPAARVEDFTISTGVAVEMAGEPFPELGELR